MKINEFSARIETLLSRNQDLVQSIMDAERLLKQSEILFRSIIENSHDVFVLLSANGTVTYESPSIERVTGYTPVERSGRPFLELIHLDDANMARHDVASVMQNPGMGKAVTRLNGRMWVTSKPGNGSTFYVFLPERR